MQKELTKNYRCHMSRNLIHLSIGVAIFIISFS
ncbi:peptidase, partial [Staphylococcus aureus]